MSTNSSNQRVIGNDFEGQPVWATYTHTDAGLQVRFSGVVRPVNSRAMSPLIPLLRDFSGGWYVDSALLPLGFRFEGGWDVWFNAAAPTGKRRLFATHEELARILREGGYSVVPSESPAPFSLVANLLSVGAAGAAIEAHSKTLGIEGGAEIQLWHLIASLNEFSAAQGISLANVVNDVRHHIQAGDLGLPAARHALGREGTGA